MLEIQFSHPFDAMLNMTTNMCRRFSWSEERIEEFQIVNLCLCLTERMAEMSWNDDT